ncbi:E3 ubiquitin-protein ligase ATL23 [Brachypodium distachyon]|uniref:RING-type domain-containing protein n=1 Tax=Brachypodium distachyon TaxID=15368 RepID=I1GZ39_BRADI|nr:E3 ubiquitin-protein ligase ATL23 [Brachypodium distachyon]KQK18634.1 hypothetical protein BRADI_1g43750v3 [Brachypodium distachyon]|eukprot:XP_003560821.1 E3 ubiquitin-protein ligase ATL23 [Brachypodium distachyon]
MVSPSAALSIAALAAGVTLMFLVHVLVIFWALRRDRDMDDAEERGAAENGSGAGEVNKVLTADELDTLPCYDFDASGGDCAVCLEAFEAGDRCRRLPRCQHSFHAPCVDSWLKKSRCCPVCRADVVGGPGELKVKVVAEEGEMPRPLPLEMAERSGGSPVALEVVSERMQEHSRGSIPDGG